MLLYLTSAQCVLKVHFGMFHNGYMCVTQEQYIRKGDMSIMCKKRVRSVLEGCIGTAYTKVKHEYSVILNCTRCWVPPRRTLQLEIHTLTTYVTGVDGAFQRYHVVLGPIVFDPGDATGFLTCKMYVSTKVVGLTETCGKHIANR